MMKNVPFIEIFCTKKMVFILLSAISTETLCVSDRVNDNVSDRVSDEASDRVSDEASDNVSDRMTDRLETERVAELQNVGFLIFIERDEYDLS